MAYNYIELESASTPSDIYIRLFHLSPGSSSGRITGQLKSVLLSESPSYTALSYCWGRDVGTLYITQSDSALEGEAPLEESLTVPGSLLSFLARSQPKTGTHAFWIDAICINQRNDREKSLQVPKMRDIYLRANRTLCWLGPEADGSTEALTYIEALNKSFRRKLAEAGLDTLTKDEVELGIPSFEFKVRLGDRQLEAICKILERPWFERAWIVQECVVSTNVWFVVGKSSVRWHALLGAIWHLVHFETWFLEFYPGHRIQYLTSIRYGEIDWRAQKDVVWWRVLLRQRHSMSSDPRDKIYAFYGLRCGEDFQRMAIKPDYEGTTAEELYIQLASRGLGFMKQAEVLNVPRLVIDKNQDENDDWHTMELPSWVPDWRWKESTPLPMAGGEPATDKGASAYDATKDSSFEVDFDNPIEVSFDRAASSLNALPKLLCVRGYTVAIITQLSPRSWTIQKPAGRQTIFDQAKVLQENQIQVAEWEPIFQPSDAPLMYASAKDTFTVAAVETLTVGNDQFVAEQRFTAWQSYERRQRFLRILPKLGLHRFLLPYVCVVLVERVLRYIGVPNPEIQFRMMTGSLVNRKCARAMSVAGPDVDFQYLSLVPGLAELGDHVVLVKGVRLPLILRPKGEHPNLVKGRTVKTWELIGDAYVHGVMKGESWDDGKCEDIWLA